MNSKRKPTPHHLLPSGPGGWSFCSCGAKTGPVGTFTKQRQWHQQHKRDARKRDGDMGWIEHGDASYIEMKNQDIAELRAKITALEAGRKPKCPDCNSVGMSHCSDPQNCGGVYWPDSYYRKLEAERDALEAENGRLRAPVSGEELVLLLGNGGSREEMATASWCRHFYDSLVAARAQQPSPAQDKEQP